MFYADGKRVVMMPLLASLLWKFIRLIQSESSKHCEEPRSRHSFAGLTLHETYRASFQDRIQNARIALARERTSRITSTQEKLGAQSRCPWF